MARTAELFSDGTLLGCVICTLDGRPSRPISNVIYTRLASVILGSTSYFNQFSDTFRCTTCTYHAKRLPKSPPPPVNPNPPFAPPALNVLYGPLTGPPSPYGTWFDSSGSG